MRRVVHLDRVRWRVDASTVSVPANLPGFVDITGVATRVGVFQYSDVRDPGAPFLEWRPPEEVLDPDSLLSLLGVPFTIDHPSVDVSSENMQALTHGWVLKVWTEGDLVYTRIRIGTEAAKRVIEAGTVELSCGYSADLEEGEGTTPSGETYHATQRNIRYNHLALVEVARAGPVARLHLDQLTTRRPYSTLRLDSQTVRVLVRADGDDQMKTITIIRKDGRKFDAPSWVRPSIDAASKQRLDEIATEEVQIGGVKLVLPKEMVEAMMTGLGIGGAAAAPVEETMGGDELTETPEETLDEGGAPPAEEGKLMSRDTKTDKLEEILAKHRKQDRQERSVERLAAAILPPTYDYDRADCWTTAAAAIKLVDPDGDSSDLAKSARRGDSIAAGRLLERLESAVKSHRSKRDRADSGDDGDDVDALAGVVVRSRLADADESVSTLPESVIPLHQREHAARKDKLRRRGLERPTARK